MLSFDEMFEACREGVKRAITDPSPEYVERRRVERLEAENVRLRELVRDWLADCLNEDCTLCHRGRALLTPQQERA